MRWLTRFQPPASWRGFNRRLPGAVSTAHAFACAISARRAEMSAISTTLYHGSKIWYNSHVFRMALAD
jgi:hypothetical protein